MKNLFNRIASSSILEKSLQKNVNTSRRQFLCACGCGLLAVSAAGSALLATASKAEAATGGPILRIGHMPAGCVAHLLLAKVRGDFAAAGIQVEVTQFNSPADALQSLLANRLDIMHAPWTMTAAAFAKGTHNIRIIGGSGKGGIELVARKGSVANLDEFISAANSGLRVGTLRLDTLELVGYGSMANHGKSYDDYKMTFFNGMAGMGEAIANGNLDVCTLAQPYAENVVKNSGAHYISDSTAVWGPEAADCVITTKAETSETQAPLLKLYLALLQSSAAKMTANYSDAVKELVPIYGVPEHILHGALARQVPHPVITPEGVSGLKKGSKYLVELGYFTEDPIDDVLDLRHQPLLQSNV